MPKYIKSIVDRIQLLNRKGLSPYYSPDQLVEEVHNASMEIWRKYVKEFEKTQIISVYLDPFRGKEVVALSSGAGTLVTSKGQYRIGILVPTTDIPVEIIDIAHWGSRIQDSIRVADVNNPIIRIDNGAIVVRPTSLTSIDVHFLKKPTKPVYAYDIVDDDYVYDDATSSDFEWGNEMHGDITERVLKSLGLSQREGSLVQYSNVEQQKEDQ